jgi:hypothetical protein
MPAAEQEALKTQLEKEAVSKKTKSREGPIDSGGKSCSKYF